MKSRSIKPKIGLEIEVNNFTSAIDDSIDRQIWKTKGEHCGYELISTPAEGAKDIRKLAKSIRDMGRRCVSNPGFKNAGTHIHIDFKSNRDYRKELTRASSTFILNRYSNPTGSGKRYYWIAPDGSIWEKPSYYIKAMEENGRVDNPALVWSSTKYPKILRDVKRFVALGIRFAPVLFALQHPDRRFNKYCHSIEDWSESILSEQQTIKSIALHPNLQQNHRRTMFNTLSFQKFGTIEIRMLKASLDYKDILRQISLFVRLATLAKSDEDLPHPEKDLTRSFNTLMDACDIHGKTRRGLTSTFNKNMDISGFDVICYNFGCQRTESHIHYTDNGLSRGLCIRCSQDFYCSVCGSVVDEDYLHEMPEDGRSLCEGCFYNRGPYLLKEQKFNSKYIFGKLVGSGVNSEGIPTSLARARELFG